MIYHKKYDSSAYISLWKFFQNFHIVMIKISRIWESKWRATWFMTKQSQFNFDSCVRLLALSIEVPWLVDFVSLVHHANIILFIYSRSRIESRYREDLDIILIRLRKFQVQRVTISHLLKEDSGNYFEVITFRCRCSYVCKIIMQLVYNYRPVLIRCIMRFAQFRRSPNRIKYTVRLYSNRIVWILFVYLTFKHKTTRELKPYFAVLQITIDWF